MVLDTIKVAIVDDNRELIGIMQEFLSQQSDIVLVGTAFDGEGILTIIAESRPDVVILDLVMPQVDGIGVLERIQDMDSERPKMLVLTGLGQEEMTQQAVSLGADYYLLKPFSIDVLLERIRQLAGRGTQHRPTTKKNESLLTHQRVTDIIREIGVPANIKGYYYVREAVLRVIENDPLIGAVSKELYQMISEKHNTTPYLVEKAIHHCIGVACDQGNTSLIDDLFGQGRKQPRIKNMEFIATIAERIRTENHLTFNDL